MAGGGTDAEGDPTNETHSKRQDQVHERFDSGQPERRKW